VSLGRVALTPEAVRELAALDLDSLTIYDTPFPREWLELLEPLPCGTVLDITPKDVPVDPHVWHDFQTRRIAKLTRLSPDERYAEALRWQRGRSERHPYACTPGEKAVIIHDVRACDAELPLLAILKEVEDVHISESDITTAGIEHIAKLPNLKHLHLSWVRVGSLAPLARCTSLEHLHVWPEYRTVIGDTGTEGLEQLVNLRELLLRYEYGELTLARLGALRKLTSLDIELQPIDNAESFAALSHLKALEHLHIGGDLPGGALQFLASCHKLNTIHLRVPTGTADDFAALGSLIDLRELHIEGEPVTDAAIRHFTPLKKLRTLLARGTEVTPAGAKWLADQLPEVTIILDEHVAKSRRQAIAFCRRLAKRDDDASALLPTHWVYSRGRSTAEPARALIEDGWGNRHGYGGEVGPAHMYLYSRDASDPRVVLDEIARFKNPSTQQESTVEELDLVRLSGNGISCIYSFANTRYFVAVVAGQNQCAVLDCFAHASRFEEFRSLFMFVARSLRAGATAREGVGEEVTVPVSQL
jgi:hypothetical protein